MPAARSDHEAANLVDEVLGPERFFERKKLHEEPRRQMLAVMDAGRPRRHPALAPETLRGNRPGYLIQSVILAAVRPKVAKFMSNCPLHRHCQRAVREGKFLGQP